MAGRRQGIGTELTLQHDPHGSEGRDNDTACEIRRWRQHNGAFFEEQRVRLCGGVANGQVRKRLLWRWRGHATREQEVPVIVRLTPALSVVVAFISRQRTLG